MTLQDFKDSLTYSEPPEGLNIQQQALWYDAQGDWSKAHSLIDHLEDPTSAHIHAYLHRVEGDLWNARYWYGRARQPEYVGSLEEEWFSLTEKYID